MTKTQEYVTILDLLLAQLVLRKCQVAKAEGEAYAVEPEDPSRRDWELSLRIKQERSELSAKLKGFVDQLDKP